jgi:hypothetical protein
VGTHRRVSQSAGPGRNLRGLVRHLTRLAPSSLTPSNCRMRGSDVAVT